MILLSSQFPPDCFRCCKMLSKPLRLGAAKPLRTELMPRSDFHSVNMNATRSFFSWGVNFVPRIKLKNSTVSSKVINRPS